MPKVFKGDVTNNVVELNLLDGNEGTLPDLGTPTIITKNTGPNVVEKVQGDIPNYSYGSSPYYFSTVRGLVIGTSCTSIGSYSFAYLESFSPTVDLGTLTIPDSVTSIGDYAFSTNYFTGPLTIGNNVTSIGNSSFSICYNFTELIIPNSNVTSIGEFAFSSDTGLTAAYINCPASSWVGINALMGTSSLTNIYVHADYVAGYDAAWKTAQGTSATVSTWSNYPNPTP